METWMLLEYCDQGNLESAARDCRFQGDFVRARARCPVLACSWIIAQQPVVAWPAMHASGVQREKSLPAGPVVLVVTCPALPCFLWWHDALV